MAQKGDEKLDKLVASIIEKMVDPSAEEKAFAELEALGCPAVPAIIRRMNDKRKLPHAHISLRNKARNAFEATRHYSPERVVDALAAILNQITGRSFGSIENGATDAERNQTIQGWRLYLRQTPPDQLCGARPKLHS